MGFCLFCALGGCDSPDASLRRAQQDQRDETREEIPVEGQRGAQEHSSMFGKRDRSGEDLLSRRSRRAAVRQRLLQCADETGHVPPRDGDDVSEAKSF